MDANPPGLQPPLPIQSNLGLRESPKRRATTRDWKPQNALGRDATRLSPSNGKAADKTRPGSRPSPIDGSKPLFPSRKPSSGALLRSKTNQSSESEKRSPSVDGSAAGREGRHFTVANVGNNGQIFLRPAVRRNHQRHPQPPAVFPIIPSNTSVLHTFTLEEVQPVEVSELNSGLWTPTPMTDPSSPSGIPRGAYFDLRLPATRRRRAASVSTAQDATSGLETPDADVFKIVISKPQNETRSKTVEDLDSTSGPFLQVSIPSWKLGTPRFTLRGTPLIRGSSHVPSDGVVSNHASFLKPSLGGKAGNPSHPETFGSRMASFLSSQSQYDPPSWLIPAGDVPPSSMVKPARLAYMPANLVIEPPMFDTLTFKPGCDDPSIVRYSPTTRAITAATPPRLVAEITSPSFLDYDLISDFFLTFRSFLNPADLLRLLVARLRWALSQDEESGMIVKVRTFVAIRHWILNYFVDDFVVDYHLRVDFCNLLNDFSDDLLDSESKHKVPLKIVGELKKCWRRMCAQYWDGPEFDADLGNNALITPGGLAGHRDPSLRPSFWEADTPKEPLSDGVSIPSAGSHQEACPAKDASRAGQVDFSSRGGVRPITPDERSIGLKRQPTSPASIASLDVVSCSFPTKALRVGDPSASMSFGAHPADPSSIYTYTDPIASTPRTLTGKRLRPQTPHRRNNSLSDSLREHGSIADKVLHKNTELQLTLPYAGSLVRGNFLPPGLPFVNLDNATNEGASRQTTVYQLQPNGVAKGKKSPASAMSGQGMRKLVGSVRRALSTKGLGIPHTHGSLIEITPTGPRGATLNRLPGTAVVPQVQHLPPDDTRQPCRIDALGARIVEDFHRAVREDTAETKSATATTTSLVENVAQNVEYSAAHLDSSFELRPLSDAAITTGSKSIVIVDGTVSSDHLFMTGALPPLNQLVETFASSRSRSQSRNPTPPVTPPSNVVRSTAPRRPSYILNQHAYEVSSTKDKDPLPLTSMTVVGTDDRGKNATRDTDQEAKSPISFVRQSNELPSASGDRYQRQQSSRSCRSRGSLSHRHWASFYSGLPARSTVKSVDVTTFSEGSMQSEIMPPPLKMLRRKPGGDLRGAANIAPLDPLPFRRSHSIGSLTAYSDSLRTSYTRSAARRSSEFIDIVSSDYAQNAGEVLSLGAIVDRAPKQQLSLFSTHSSKPIMRPSFEVEAQKLAQIPDDVDDDGGIESTLLKLEGKYERKKARRSIESLRIPDKEPRGPRAESLLLENIGQANKEKQKHRNLRVGEEVLDTSPTNEVYDVDSPMQGQFPGHSKMSSFLSEESLKTCNSIPLLDTGLEADETHSTREWTNHSILEGPDTPVEDSEALATSSSQYPSFEFINRTESLDRAVGNTSGKPNEDHSFLDVDSDNDSELSSELSAEMIDESDYIPGPLSPGKAERHASPHVGERQEMNAHANDDRCSLKLTLMQALRIAPPEMEDTPQVCEQQFWSQKPLPPTPDATPIAAVSHQALGSPLRYPMPHQTPSKANRLLGRATEQPAAHLPFILAFDSEILAQQFTLIEKDALIEVDWKELIEMRWKDSHNDSRSWVDFLRNSDARGVEVIIARFNIMVKWAISEIVLTRELEERARCIIKLLHIAAHCRKHRNFATMSQITVALTSNEIGRLSKTWAMVPPADVKIMSDLEILVSPTKNFYNLRAEMEGGGNAADTGCIPFVGIYTHDLLFNSQRPSEIASSPTTPPLVNFERCRVTASIVKTLLRLLEASTHYQFQPIEGITERCLWMSALSDDEIRRKSESLE